MSADLLETALLLFLRHVQHYFDPGFHASAASRQSRTIPPGFDMAASKSAAQQAFRAVASRVSDIKLTKAVLGVDPRPHEALLEQIVRRISSELLTEAQAS